MAIYNPGTFTRIRRAGALCALATLLIPALPVHAEEHEVMVNSRDSFFSPQSIEVEVGDTVRWTNQGNLAHNGRADDSSFRCADGCDGEGGNGNPSNASWTFTRTFDEPGEYPYFCEVHGSPGGFGMAGTVTVVPAQDPDPEPEFAINFGLTGSWRDRSTSGQGFLFDVVIGQDPPQVVAYWFAYDTEPGGPEGQRWFIAQGPFEEGSNTVELDVNMFTGGAFDQGEPAPQGQSIGAAILEFASCTEATLTFDLDFDGDSEQNVTGTQNLERLSPDVMCEELRDEDGEQ